MASSLAVSIIIGLASLIISVAASAFVAGSRWGTVSTRLTALESQACQAATKTDLAVLQTSVSRIEGMFEVRLRAGGAVDL